MSSNELHIELESFDNAFLITPVGDVDLSQSDQLRQVIKDSIKSMGQKIVVDLSHVRYMDSSGVATLIEGLQLARTSGKDLVLCSLTQSVEAVIQLSKLDKIFDIFSSKELAIES